MGRVLGTAKSVRGPRLVLGSGRAGLTTQHEQALMEQPGEREQPGREPDPRPGVAELWTRSNRRSSGSLRVTAVGR